MLDYVLKLLCTEISLFVRLSVLTLLFYHEAKRLLVNSQTSRCETKHEHEQSSSTWIALKKGLYQFI